MCSLKLLPWLFINCMYVSKACIKIVLPRFCTGGWRPFCGGSEDWQERLEVGNSHLCLVFLWALGRVLLLETFSQWEALLVACLMTLVIAPSSLPDSLVWAQSWHALQNKLLVLVAEILLNIHVNILVTAAIVLLIWKGKWPNDEVVILSV